MQVWQWEQSAEAAIVMEVWHLLPHIIPASRKLCDIKCRTSGINCPAVLDYRIQISIPANRRHGIVRRPAAHLRDY